MSDGPHALLSERGEVQAGAPGREGGGGGPPKDSASSGAMARNWVDVPGQPCVKMRPHTGALEYVRSAHFVPHIEKPGCTWPSLHQPW